MSFGWVLDDDINLSDDGAGGILVTEASPDEDHPYPRQVRLTYHDGELRINGAFVDVGDDFPRFLGIMDAASEGVTFIGDTSSHSGPDDDDPCQYGVRRTP